MLIESACSVDRVEEALSTLLPMLPEIHYFRFNPGNVLTAYLFILHIGMELAHLFYFPFVYEKYKAPFVGAKECIEAHIGHVHNKSHSTFLVF